MHPITLPIAELRSALLGLGKIIPPRSSPPVLNTIKMDRTADGWIALTVSNLRHFVTVRLEHPSEGPAMSLLIPYDQLQQLTKNRGKDESLIIENTPQGTVIKDKTGESKVKLAPVDQFPATPRIRAQAVPLSQELHQSFIEALDCSCTDESRPALNGVFIDLHNPRNGYIVASDGKHLYSANSFTLPLRNSILIPNHKFLKWSEFNRDGEWQLRSDHEFVQISSRRWRFISKQVDGKYPDWKLTVPNPATAKTHITIDPVKLEFVVRLVQRLPAHDGRFHSIGLEWKNGQAQFMVKDTNDEPWTRVPIPGAKGEGPELTIFFNRQFLIKAFEYGLNTISLISFVSPIRFHNKGRQVIVMPIRPVSAQSQPPVNRQRLKA